VFSYGDVVGADFLSDSGDGKGHVSLDKRSEHGHRHLRA